MAPEPPEGKEEKVRALDEDDIALLKSYGQGPYSARIKEIEKDVKDTVKKVNDVSGIKESDTGLAAPSRWDLVSDKQAMQEEQPLQVSILVCYIVRMSLPGTNVGLKPSTDAECPGPTQENHAGLAVCLLSLRRAGKACISKNLSDWNCLITGGQVHQDH